MSPPVNWKVLSRIAVGEEAVGEVAELLFRELASVDFHGGHGEAAVEVGAEGKEGVGGEVELEGLGFGAEGHADVAAGGAGHEVADVGLLCGGHLAFHLEAEAHAGRAGGGGGLGVGRGGGCKQEDEEAEEEGEGFHG